MARFTMLLGLAVAVATLPACIERGDDPGVIATVLVLENRSACLDLARDERLRDPVALAGRLALARETLWIAEEAVNRMSREGTTGVLSDAIRVERRLCFGRLSRGERGALAGELERAVAELERLVPIGEQQRARILEESLDRREAAALEAIKAARRRVEGGAAAPQRFNDSTRNERRNDASATREIASLHVAPVAARRDEPGSDVAARAARVSHKKQEWNPTPKELGRRRRARQAEFRDRLADWRVDCQRELRPLSSARAALERELADRSLEQLRMSCSRLGDVAKSVDYLMVLETPESTLRSHLDRLLAGYVAAGRWCNERRYSFAWLEIQESDRRWQQLRERLERLGSSRGKEPLAGPRR